MISIILSSRPFMCSVSSSLLLIPYSVFFICLYFSVLILLFSVLLLMKTLWILYLVNCLFLFHSLFFQGFPPTLSIETNSSVFLFCFFYLISQRNSLQVSLCGAIPIQSACAHGFAGRAGFTLNTGHTFPESMMVAVPLLGGVARGGGARARDELAVWPSAVTSLSGTGSGLKSLQHKSWGSVWAGSLPSVSPPHTSPRGNSARTRGAGVGTPSVGACAIGPAKVTDPDCFWYSACNGCPQPAHTLLQVWVASVSHGLSRKQDYRVSV